MIKKGLISIVFFLNAFCVVSQDSRLVDSLKAIIRTGKEDTTKINAINKLANQYRYREPKTSLIYAREGLKEAIEVKYKRGQGDAMHVLGSAHNYLSNFDSALFYYRKSLAIRTSLNDKHGISVSSNNIGLAYYNKGDLENALKYYLISSKMDDELKDKKGMASSYNNIGLIYMNQRNFDKALEYYNYGLAIYEFLNDKQGAAGCYTNMGGVYYYKTQQNEAVLYFKKALKLYEEIDYKTGIASCCANIGEALNELKRPSEAMVYEKKAVEMERKQENKSGLTFGLLSLSKTYLNLNKNEEAHQILQEAISLAREIKALKQVSEGYLLMAWMYKNKKNYQSAFEYQDKHMDLKDSLLNADNSSHMTEMSAKYETDKKTKEIDLLKKEKQIQHLKQNAEKIKSKNIRNSLIAGFIIVLIVVGLLYNRYQVKQRANVLLEQKNMDIENQKTQIEEQNNELTFKNKEITDSIVYAKRIQEAILPPVQQIKQLLPDSFILYMPKDIVSGDFYWIEQWGNKTLFAAVDCTGHGVPGAFMSIVGNNLLNQALNELGLNKPALILNSINKGITKALRQSAEKSSVKDGMDITLCSLDKEKMMLEFAGAYNSIYIIRNKELIEYAGDKFPVGAFMDEEIKMFNNHEIPVSKGDIIYLLTDGYADQFGGPKGKKYKYKPLKELMLKNAGKSMEDQRIALESNFIEWRGNKEQVDDVCIIGVRV